MGFGVFVRVRSRLTDVGERERYVVVSTWGVRDQVR